jgi:hypothetical protein
MALGYEVSSVYLIRDAVTGTSPCFAHVQLADVETLDDAARALNSREFARFDVFEFSMRGVPWNVSLSKIGN